MCRGQQNRIKKKLRGIKGSERGQFEWDLDLMRVKQQNREDEVIADEEGKVASSEEGRQVKLTKVLLVQSLICLGEVKKSEEKR